MISAGATPGVRRRRRRRRHPLGASKRSDRAGLGNDSPKLGESSAFGLGTSVFPARPGLTRAVRGRAPKADRLTAGLGLRLAFQFIRSFSDGGLFGGGGPDSDP